MEEAKFNNLCSHYRDTFDVHRTSRKQRDTLFYGLLIILSVFTLQLSSTEAVTIIVSEFISKSTGIKLGGNIDFISTFLWLFMLGFTTRYYQLVIEIERQYSYLHVLEKNLNTFYPGSKVFTREGEFYLSNHPRFSNWVWSLYTLVFPILIIFCVFMRIFSQVEVINFIEVNQLIDFICFLIVEISSILYIYELRLLSQALVVVRDSRRAIVLSESER